MVRKCCTQNDSNVNGYDCIDQIDCLLIALYDIASILNDTPLEEAELIFQNIVDYGIF